MKAITLSFTLKNQDFNLIKSKILEIKSLNPEHNVLIHGFMARGELEEKGISTEVIDFLESEFSKIYNLRAEGVTLRKDIASLSRRLNSLIYVIGDKTASGVVEEIQEFESLGLTINYIPI